MTAMNKCVCEIVVIDDDDDADDDDDDKNKNKKDLIRIIIIKCGLMRWLSW